MVVKKDGTRKLETVAGYLYEQGGYHFHAIAQPDREAQPRPPAEAVGDLGAVHQLFATAAKHLKRPAIVLYVAGLRDNIRLTPSPENSQYAGSVRVTSQDRPFGAEKRTWYGAITAGGAFIAGKLLVDRQPLRLEVTELLRRFAADPATVAAEHGRLTGNCCFCHRPLTDERSTAVGYGAKCASTWGMRWGKKPESFAATPAGQPGLF